MKRKPIKKLIESPVVISGIYNYCDRWCERCAFTQRCVNYSMSQSVEDGTFEQEMEDLYADFDKKIEDLGIDIPDIEDMPEESIEERKLRHEKVDENESAILSQAYYKTVSSWIKSNEKILEEKKLEYKKNKADDRFIKLNDDVDVISWYLFQIHVKIARALHGLVDDLLDEPDDLPKDSDGSAKVALIGIDNSIIAWKNLLNHFPNNEEISDLILLLEQLTKMVEKTFPDARKFIRPGFDEVQN